MAMQPRASGKKHDILVATRSLFWERGFEATSPSAVMQRSGAGQGSLYHHFRSKQALGVAVLDGLACELIASAEDLLAPRPASCPLTRVLAYLQAPRQGARGCKLGRFANEASVVADPELRAPIRRYFERLGQLLHDAFVEARESGALSSCIDPADAAATVMASVQGAYVLARSTGDETRLTAALRGAAGLVKLWAA